MKHFLRFSLVSFSISFLVSILAFCANSSVPSEGSSENTAKEIIHKTPYASEKMLNDLAQNNTLVDWRVSRFFAVIQMKEFSETQSWENFHISEHPIVIYHTHKNNPRFYEFRVLDNNQKEVGAIVGVAEKNEGDPIQYVLDFAHPIDEEQASSMYNDKKFIDLGYPSVLIVADKNNEYSYAKNSKLVTEEYPLDAKIEDFLNHIDKKTLEDMGISEADKKTYLQEQKEETTRLNSLWKEIDKAKENIVAVSYKEIEESPLPVVPEPRSVVAQTILWDWYNKRNWYNPGGWCGPSVVSFITLGLGQKSGYPAIPLVNDKYAIRNMYHDFERSIGTGPKLYFQLRKGIEAKTNYTIRTHFAHIWSTIHNHLTNTGLPAISLRSSIWFKSWGWHYRTIIGTEWERVRYRHRFLWWTWYSYSNRNWYYMKDNGHDGNHWWEKSWKYYQLHSAGTYKK